VKRQVDVIVALSTTAARPAKQATSVIPIVGIAMADPVADDLVASLCPAGRERYRHNVSGPQLLTKRLQLLSEVPHSIRASLFSGILTHTAIAQWPAWSSSRGRGANLSMPRAFLDIRIGAGTQRKRCPPRSPVRCNTSGRRQSYGLARLCAADYGRGSSSGEGREADRETVLPVERKVRREGEGGDIRTGG
jgi:hypothetical protein